jgi:hypothetical protein
MAQRATAIFGDQIDSSVASLGLKKNASDNLEVVVDDITLEIQTISGVGDAVAIKVAGVDTAQLADNAVTEDKIDFFNTPTDGYIPQWNASEGKFEWVDVTTIVDADSVQDDDIITGETPTGDINSTNDTFTLANTPITGTVRVYLNGMRQTEGVSEDYTISGTTITLDKAPTTNSTLRVDYFIQ